MPHSGLHSDGKRRYGRQPLQNIGLRTEDGWDISGEDVQIWLEEQGENSFAISAYCEKLLPMLRDEEGRAWWMRTTLTDQVLGEISHMRYIDSFDVLEEPKAEPSFLLSQLPAKLREPVSYTHLLRSIDIFAACRTRNIPDLYAGAIEITPIPTVEELNAHVWGEEFHACIIEQAEFEAIWESRFYSGAF